MSSQASAAQAPIGLIVPPAHGRVPPDGAQLYPQLRFIARGLGLASVTPTGYDGVIDSVLEHARALRRDGAQAISLMGTSLSFYRGPAFNRELIAQMQQATDVPCTTMSAAIIAGLRALGAQRVAVATGYVDEVNRSLQAYLAAEGLEVTTCQGLGVSGVEAMQAVGTTELVALCREVYAAAPESDAILLSCGGLMTLDAVPQLERELGVPVVASSPAGFWDVARLAGYASPVSEHSRLLRVAQSAS